MKCELAKRHELITHYLSSELSENESAKFEEHYLQCEACFKELKVAEDAVNLIEKDGPAILGPRETEARSVEQSIRRWSRQPRWRFAIAGVAAVTVVSLIILNSFRGTDIDFTGPSFVPEAYMEEWVIQSTRAGDEIISEVHSPQIGEKLYEGQITFRWTMFEEIPVSLKILSNLEAEILDATAGLEQFPEFTIEVDTKIFKESGLYYWRIEDEENVLFVGKFYFLGNNP